MNMHWEPLDFELPSPPQNMRWHGVANTAASAPEDIWEPGSEPPIANQASLTVGGRSIVVLIAK